MTATFLASSRNADRNVRRKGRRTEQLSHLVARDWRASGDRLCLGSKSIMWQGSNVEVFSFDVHPSNCL
eukprot:CAMPEP_0172736526 /NCGR_PEP_ID=MMETSP1074-20121228/115313_1 /TAXON_ID=2916 /ORGANISM="Ceratium fusus, Strain PA161109" /LENGTH=68 /DNA_ID=CAMNT_0013565743 /DNA_START=542 /DNA_END=745 /DNA_ORIENTATION=-